MIFGDGVKAVMCADDDGRFTFGVRRLDVDAQGRRVFFWAVYEWGRYVAGGDDLRGPVGELGIPAIRMLGALASFLSADAERYDRRSRLVPGIDGGDPYATDERAAEFAYAYQDELAMAAIALERTVDSRTAAGSLTGREEICA